MGLNNSNIFRHSVSTQLRKKKHFIFRCHQRFQHYIHYSYGICKELLQRKQTGLLRECCQSALKTLDRENEISYHVLTCHTSTESRGTVQS